MADVKFVDNSVKVKGAINKAIIAGLYEGAGELEGQAKRNTRRDHGQTAGSWTYKVEESKGEAVVGSPLENAIWEEFGTGEYALKGDGRKGGWYVPESKLSSKAKSKMKRVEIKGQVYYYTKGKKPSRAFWKAFVKLKPKIPKIFADKLKGLGK